MKKLELNQMEKLNGGSDAGLAAGLTCGMMLAGIAGLVIITGGFAAPAVVASLSLGGAIAGTAVGTAGCGLSVAWSFWS